MGILVSSSGVGPRKNWEKEECLSFPDGSVGKESTCNTGDIGCMSLIPGLGRSPAEGNGNPLQYCLETPMDRGAWWARVQRVTKSQTGLSN